MKDSRFQNKAIKIIKVILAPFALGGCLGEMAIGCLIGVILAVVLAPIFAVAHWMSTKECRHCKNRINKEATKCPNCGGWQRFGQDEN